jgi:hypothetical protein
MSLNYYGELFGWEFARAAGVGQQRASSSEKQSARPADMAVGGQTGDPVVAGHTDLVKRRLKS